MNHIELNRLLKEKSAKWTANENSISKLDEITKKHMLGAVKPPGYEPFNQTREKKIKDFVVPSSIDWRNNNGNFVTSVKNQGGCGSCVGFGITAAMESRLAIESNIFIDLSVADAFFCSNHGATCSGWWPGPAYQANQVRGICQELLFPYSSAFPNNNIYAGPPTCIINPNRNENAFTYGSVNSFTDMNAVKNYLANTGPLTACFDVYEDFDNYSSGIYHHVTGNYRGGHCICVVGYCDDEGGYWICKNSWGTDWGMQGFFNIAYGQCNIDTNEKIGVTQIAIPNIVYPYWIPAVKIEGQSTGGPITLSVMNNALHLIYGDNRGAKIWTTTSSNGLNWINTASLPGQSCKVAASCVVFNGKLWLVYEDDQDSGQLWVTFCDANGTWAKAIAIAGQSTSGPISLTVFNNQLYLIYRDSSSSKIWMTTSENGTDWQNTNAIPGQTCINAASAVVFQNMLWLVYEDSDGGKMWVTSCDAKGTWAKAIAIAGQGTGGPITLSVINNQLFLVYGDNSSAKIWTTTSSNGSTWINPAPLSGQSCKNAASSAVFQGRLWLVYEDDQNSDQLWITSYQPGKQPSA